MSRTQYYSDASREKEVGSLPNLEVWESIIYEVSCDCGDYEVSKGYAEAPDVLCPSCEKNVTSRCATERKGWFYWFCFPGCMPDSDEHGPFKSKKQALEEARGE